MFRKAVIILKNIFIKPKVQTPEEYWRQRSVRIKKR